MNKFTFSQEVQKGKDF